jgi:rare lipoprotein A
MVKQLRFILITLLLVNGCATQTGRYKHANDSTPTRIPTQAEMQDATPRIEQPSRG